MTPLTLCYHGLGYSHPLAVGSTDFSKHVATLTARRYEFVTAGEVWSSMRRAVAVTFDDGCRSVLDVAAPVLRAAGVPATAFVVTDAVSGGEISGLSAYAPMRWAELRELVDMGWEIGSHTRTHAVLTELSDREASEELRDSRSEIEDRLGVQCRALAYPYGRADARTRAIARRAGYEAAFTVSRRLGGRDDWMRPRLSVGCGDTAWVFGVKTSATSLALRESTVGAVAAAACARLLALWATL